MLVLVCVFSSRPADMGTENIQDCLPYRIVAPRVLRQVEEFVGAAQTHGFRLAPQVFNGVLQALLPQPMFSVFVGSCLCFRGLLHRVRPPVGDYSLQYEDKAADTDSQVFQDFAFLG